MFIYVLEWCWISYRFKNPIITKSSLLRASKPWSWLQKIQRSSNILLKLWLGKFWLSTRRLGLIVEIAHLSVEAIACTEKVRIRFRGSESEASYVLGTAFVNTVMKKSKISTPYARLHPTSSPLTRLFIGRLVEASPPPSLYHNTTDRFRIEHRILPSIMKFFCINTILKLLECSENW